MKFLYNKPIDQTITEYWNSIDRSYKNAFPIVLGICLLAFGFEMSNLTLHHDDVTHIFIEDDILGYYLGRFGFGKLHFYAQNAYIMPFLQMVEGMVLMTFYGLLISRFWGVRNLLDIILISSVLCVFPYMAQIYQYNTSMGPFTLAHLLVAIAVILSTRVNIVYIVISAILYTAAFSIYQGVVANSATILFIWILSALLFPKTGRPFYSMAMLKSLLAAIVSVITGGIIYIALVSTMNLNFDSYQSAGKAFSIGDSLNLIYAISEVFNGTRSFYLWPENYFPDYLKKLQLVLLLIASILCIWLPKNAIGKINAILLMSIAVFVPRILQLLHPEGTYHNLTLTAYAVVIAGAVMVISRSGIIFIRNGSVVLLFFLISGYILQCNWISTVSYLNTLAHYTTMTQLLSRIRSLPNEEWDGKKIAVVGTYDMRSDYPFKPATGVATEYLDASHMQKLARLMREDVTFVKASTDTPGAFNFASRNSPWPNPNSVGVIDGIGVVVLSKNSLRSD